MSERSGASLLCRGGTWSEGGGNEVGGGEISQFRSLAACGPVGSGAGGGRLGVGLRRGIGSKALARSISWTESVGGLGSDVQGDTRATGVVSGFAGGESGFSEGFLGFCCGKTVEENVII